MKPAEEILLYLKPGTKFYIYEVPGVKIGCSTEPLKRTKYGQGFASYIILEKHTDVFIASERERVLQKEKGYKLDKAPYFISLLHRLKWVNSLSTEQKREAGIKGGSVGGYNMSQEARKKISHTRVGKPVPSFEGHCHSEETKKKLSEKLKGRPNYKLKGRPLTEEHRTRISEGAKGKQVFDEERRAAISKLHKGKILSTNTINKLTFSMNVKYLCPDGHITTCNQYKKYCLRRGLDYSLVVKIQNNN